MACLCHRGYYLNCLDSSLWWPVGNLAITRTDPLSKPSGTLRGAAHRGKPGERSLFPYPMFQPTGGTSVASTAGSMLAPTRCLSPRQGQAGLAEARLDAADPVAATPTSRDLAQRTGGGSGHRAATGQEWLHPLHGGDRGIHVGVCARPREDTKVGSRGQRKPGLCPEVTCAT